MRPRHPATWRVTIAARGSSMPATSMILDALRRPLLHKAKHVTRDAAHLDFLGTFGDAVAPVVTINVFKRLVTRVSQSAVHLHGTVGRLATQSVGPVVAHRDLIGDREVAVLIHAPCRLMHERTQHLALSLQF